jgi:hypothetical protein
LIRISCDEDEDDDEDDHDEDIAINGSIVSLKPEISRSALRRCAISYGLCDYFTYVIPGTLRALMQPVTPQESFGVVAASSS